MAHATQMSFWT